MREEAFRRFEPLLLKMQSVETLLIDPIKEYGIKQSTFVARLRDAVRGATRFHYTTKIQKMPKLDYEELAGGLVRLTNIYLQVNEIVSTQNKTAVSNILAKIAGGQIVPPAKGWPIYINEVDDIAWLREQCHQYGVHVGTKMQNGCMLLLGKSVSMAEMVDAIMEVPNA